MLTKIQEEAVNHFDSPLLLLAGPGTGKTHVLCEKVLKLLSSKEYSSSNVLALTFTEKAAQEMSERVNKEKDFQFQAFTFHSFAKELLDEFLHLIPELPSHYTLLEESYGKLIIRRLLDEHKLNSQEVKNNKDNLARELFSAIMRLKEEGIRIEELEKLNFDNLSVKIDIMTFYSRYEQFKLKYALLDFSDLLLYLKKLLESKSEVLKEVKSRVSYLLVDEFQDLNKIQYELMKLLAPQNRLCVVGDPKQSIYGFRGGSSSFFDEFKKDFSTSKELILKENFRSSKEVLSLLNSYLHSIADPSHELSCEKSERGLVEYSSCLNEEVQKASLLREIFKAQKEGKTVGILARRRTELFELSSFLSQQGIEHGLAGESSFLYDPIVKDLVHLFSFLSSPKESSLHLFAFLESFQLRKETLQKLSRTAYRMKCPLFEVLDVKGLSSSAEEGEFLFEIKEKLKKLLDLKGAGSSALFLFRNAALLFSLYERAELRGIDAMRSLASFERFIQESPLLGIETLSEFIEYTRLSKQFNFSYDEDESEASYPIQLLTFHQSKGKEFDYVFLPSLNERRFPSSFRQKLFPLLMDVNREQFIEEEKRLFFVALSRAKEALFLSYVKKFKGNKLESKASSFLSELQLGKEKEESQEIISRKKSRREEVKSELISRIHTALQAEQFSLARKELTLLEQVLKKGKDLQAFMGPSHPELERFEKKIKEGEESHPYFDSKNQYYSVSQLQTYRDCPRKYLYQQVYKLQGTGKHYFDFGSSMHKVLELLLDMIAEGKSSKELLFAKGLNLLKEHWISQSYESGEQEEQYYEKGIEALRLFIEHELNLRKSSQRKTLSKEEKFFMEYQGKKITGFIDRIDELENGDYEVIDYKTSNSMESEKDLKKNLQLYIYAKALEHLKGRTPHELSLWYLIHDEKKSVTFSSLDLEGIEAEIASLFEGIEEKKFDAKPSFSCRFCDYESICPFAKK